MTTELPDVNVLLALHVAEHPAHPAATKWFRQANNVIVTPVSEIGLIRLLLNPAVVLREITGEQALAAASHFRSLPNVRFESDGTSLTDPKVRVTQLSGKGQVTDLHLFNLAVSLGARFVTLDRKFIAPLRSVEQHHVLMLDA